MDAFIKPMNTKLPDGTRVGFLIWRGGQEVFFLGRKE
jgi:hypothetical protein